MGFCSGVFFHQIKKTFLFYAGMASTFMFVLTWSNIITINWARIDSLIFSAFFHEKKKRQSKAEAIFSLNIVGACFVLGVRRGYMKAHEWANY